MDILSSQSLMNRYVIELSKCILQRFERLVETLPRLLCLGFCKQAPEIVRRISQFFDRDTYFVSPTRVQTCHFPDFSDDLLFTFCQGIPCEHRNWLVPLTGKICIPRPVTVEKPQGGFEHDSPITLASNSCARVFKAAKASFRQISLQQCNFRMIRICLAQRPHAFFDEYVEISRWPQAFGEPLES